jgi:NAD(P)-dependent dehydrogenase (short-subunit alcohol dehydrogenase family)
MTGKIIIITGANRGIGYQATLALARQGHTIVMACRNLEAAKRAQDELKKASGNTDIHLLRLDLGDVGSIKSFAGEFGSRFKELNVLVNNAAITSREKKKTKDGYDLVVGTNYLGPYLLTKLLLPYFKDDSDNRIINLTSGIYPMGRFRFEKINQYAWIKSYAVSKYLMLLFTFKLAQVLAPRRISVNAVDPGVVRTNIMFTDKWYDAIIAFILAPFFISPEKGSETVSYLAASEEARGLCGECFYKRRIKRIPRRFKDDKLIEPLFRQTDELLNLKG